MDSDPSSGGPRPAAADRHDLIEVRGARENNLAGISFDIPKRRLTVFTGVSGSGKSSLVFGTIAAESQRLINETYSAFLQSFMPSLGRPDADALHNLSAAIVVDQERMGANSRSTVGTATDAYTMLRIVFSRLGTPHIGTSSAFSFNVPEGMCPECEGLGRVSQIDVDQLLALLDRLVDDGNTVVVIEHHQAVMAHADWIVDLGPGAGHDGGQVVFTGTPAELVAEGDTLTARHLREYVAPV